jgi:hypothetical protein
MTAMTGRKAIDVTVEMSCRDAAVTLGLRDGFDPRDEFDRGGYHPVGKTWRTLRRGDTVRGPDGYEFIVRRVTLREADPPLARPIEIESVAAWAATGLSR